MMNLFSKGHRWFSKLLSSYVIDTSTIREQIYHLLVFLKVIKSLIKEDLISFSFWKSEKCLKLVHNCTTQMSTINIEVSTNNDQVRWCCMSRLSFDKLSYFLNLRKLLIDRSLISIKIGFNVVCLRMSIEEIEKVALNFNLCKHNSFRAHCINIKVPWKVMFIRINNRKPAQN